MAFLRYGTVHPAFRWGLCLFYLFLWIACSCRAEAASNTPSAAAGSLQEPQQARPSIQVSGSVFDFGEVMEGNEVVHEFTVKNEGGGILQIENVRPGCGCTAAQFDRTVPAGGRGKITLRLDTTGYRGKVEKAATVFSNDPERPRLVLTLEGLVKNFIDVLPSSSVTFRSAAGEQSPKVIELVGTKPFRVVKVESTLEGKVSHELEPMDGGKGYRLKISNVSRQGTYTGSIRVMTDLPEKPEVLIRVNGRIQGDIVIKP